MESMINTSLDARGVMTIELNRPDVHNAFNDELIEKMISLFEKIEQDKHIRLIILSGAGKSFCAGADLNWMKSMKGYSKEENFEDSKKLAKMFHLMNQCSVPLIGKVHGHALGGGVGLVSICDFVHASRRVLMGFTEVRLGLIPAVISHYVMAKIGETWARAYFLSGERFDTEIATSIGLVHRVSDDALFEIEFEKTIESFLAAAPNATKIAKTLVKSLMSFDEKDIENFTCMAISEQRISEEGQEGMNALLEKRSPEWKK